MRPGDTTWVLISAALVLFMTPGLALFYGGMVRAKNVLNIIMQNFITIALVSVLWVLLVFSLVFGKDIGHGLLGNLGMSGMSHLGSSLPGFHDLTVSPLVMGIFQMMFAVITAALITGGTAERIKFSSFVILIVLWTVVVYAPIAHWVFSPDGWLARRGVLDFAGGTVVEINSGFSTLGIVLILGRRRGWPSEANAPHSIPLSLTGAGILWFGWFGFNAGSALSANSVAIHAFLNTQVAACTGLLGWLIVERLTEHYATTVGAAAGAIAGMVAITPCAGFVGTMPSLLIGAVAGVVCAFAVRLKFKLGYDDALDVLGVHGIGGVIGMVLLGVFATTSINSAGANGLASGGGFHLLSIQILATLVTIGYSLGMSAALAKGVDLLMGLRITPDAESAGLDATVHAERAYSTGGSGGMRR
ncbi:MAG TPA: ammonium transporter [Acidimicrobiales bacterium]|nr:ammonium transporter [Acidimicrobiales bacterium]